MFFLLYFMTLTSAFRINVKKYALEISDVTLSDAGRYSCKAENGVGTKWGNFSIKVIKGEYHDSVVEIYEKRINDNPEEKGMWLGVTVFETRYDLLCYSFSRHGFAWF